MNNVCIIYKVTNNINTKIYVGQTWIGLRRRWDCHCRKMGCIKLYSAIKKHGKENFRIEMITVTHMQEIADYWETYFINKYNSIKEGYNIKEGGSRGKWAEESKAKVSKANMGHPVSIETRKKLSKAHMGKIVSDEARKNMSIAQTGKKYSEEIRKRMRGAGNPNVKLTRNQVDEIIALYATGNYTSRQLAKKFKVGKSTILRIINKTSWKT